MSITRTYVVWCLFFASCAAPRENIAGAPARASPVALHHEYELPAVLTMVRAGLEDDYPAYLDEFSREDCSSELPSLDGLDVCADAIGSAPTEDIQRFCAHMSVKALIVSTTCSFPEAQLERYARLAVYYTLALSQREVSVVNPNPRVRLMAALAIAVEYLSGQEQCVPVRQFVREMKIANVRYMSVDDWSSADQALTAAIRYARPCVPEDEVRELIGMQRSVSALQHQKK